MPQLSILPGLPAMTSLQITITPKPPGAQAGWDVHVKVSTGNQPLKSRWVGSLEGYETDYLDTLVQDVVHAFQFGETTKDVAKAATLTRKSARVHAANY